MAIAIPNIRNVSIQVMAPPQMPKGKGVFAEIDCEGYRRESRACSQQGDSNLFPAHIKIILRCAAPHNRPMTENLVPACGRFLSLSGVVGS
jgi:hypothetical protein